MFRDRVDAGRQLAELVLTVGRYHDPIVLGLPRGGVPVALEVAKALDAPLDVLVVRKLGAPGNPEYAVGAIGANGARVVDSRALRSLGVDEAALGRIERAELAELARRESAYRSGRGALDLSGRTAIVVDDGIATGATASVACRGARALGAERVILAVPVAPAGWRDEALRERADDGTPIVDDVVVLLQPHSFWAVGQWYRDFRQTTDDEVLAALSEPSG
jgi:predicted phosphoribosyltransferase